MPSLPLHWPVPVAEEVLKRAIKLEQWNYIRAMVGLTNLNIPCPLITFSERGNFNKFKQIRHLVSIPDSLQCGVLPRRAYFKETVLCFSDLFAIIQYIQPLGKTPHKAKFDVLGEGCLYDGFCECKCINIFNFQKISYRSCNMFWKIIGFTSAHHMNQICALLVTYWNHIHYTSYGCVLNGCISINYFRS